MRTTFALAALALLALLATGEFPAGGYTPCTRDHLQDCLRAVLFGGDPNATQVVAADFDTFLASSMGMSCLDNSTEWRTRYTGAALVGWCDVNTDGVLDATDWGANATTGCGYNPYIRDYLCRACYACGWNGPV